MKSILFALALFSSVSANSIHWQSNYDKAHHHAVQKSKKIMVFLIEKDNPQNNKILINTFMDQSYIDIINNEFISVLITKNQKISYPIESLFTVEYPVVFFLDDKDLFVCNPLSGEITPKRLEAHLEECR